MLSKVIEAMGKLPFYSCLLHGTHVDLYNKQYRRLACEL